jgi:ketopantoate hydroxymethyltransferase
MSQAISAYRDEVKGGQFPTKENSFIIDTAVLEQVKAKLS